MNGQTMTGPKLERMPRTARLTLRGRGDAAQAMGEVLGLGLPSSAMTSAVEGDHLCFWLGPDEWLLLAAESERAGLLKALGRLRADHHLAVVDVSDNTMAMALEGPRVREVLAMGCPLDLHAREVPEGWCSRTVLGKSEVVLHRAADADAGPRFEILVRRSFAAYLWAWLEASLEKLD